MSYANIPLELQRLIQWCCWRYERPEENEKITKVPYNPVTGKHMSVANPQTWCSFDEAASAATNHPDKWAGIGFVFTRRDPYCGIDLDDPFALNADGSPKYSEDKQKEIAARHAKTLANYHTYAELSPSGKGVHLIVKASVPRGRKRDGTEVYSEGRFFTMTGKVLPEHNVIIADYNNQVNEAWKLMAPADIDNVNGFIGDLQQHHEDAEIFLMAERAENGDKFVALYGGNWQPYYSSQSEADFALINIISFYTQNVPQIFRMFRESALGHRNKAKRDDYVGKMVQRSFDIQLDTSNIEQIQKSFDAAQVPVRIEPPKPEPVAKPVFDIDLDYWTKIRPPGILNQIIDYGLAVSPRPVYEISLVAALGLLAGIAGRQFNVSKTGLNQYIMMIADTGTGKEAINMITSNIMSAVANSRAENSDFPSALEFIGPGDFGSGQGILKYMSSMGAPCMYSLIGEFGLKLKTITDEKANNNDTILRKVLLDLYAKSGAGMTVNPTVYSDRKNNAEPINSPSLTIIGESTRELFYEALGEDAVRSGLLPRFLIVEYNGKRVEPNDNHFNVEFPEQLRMAFDAFILYVQGLAQAKTAYEIGFNDDARAYSKSLNRYCDKMMDNSDIDAIMNIWNRVHLKAIKLAGLLAVSYDYKYPQIDLPMMQWATSLVMTDTMRLLGKFERGEMGTVNETKAQLDAIKNELKHYLYDDITKLKTIDPVLWNEKVIPRSWLSSRLFDNKAFRKVKGASKVINDHIDNMIKDGKLCRIDNNSLARITKKTGFHIGVVDYEWLNRV